MGILFDNWPSFSPYLYKLVVDFDGDFDKNDWELDNSDQKGI